MVSPADEWEDTESGYESGNVRIQVAEVEGRIIDDGERYQFEGFEVRVWDGPPGYASPTEIATYEEPRKAWELANILTHYFSEHHGPMMDFEHPEHGESLPRGLAEREPEKLLRDVLGFREFRLDEALPD